MADKQESRFSHITIEGIVTIILLLAGIIGGYTKLEDAQKANADAVKEAKQTVVEVKKANDEHNAKVDIFITKVDGTFGRQSQVDKDCPRHRHVDGRIIYCGQTPSLTTDPPAFGDEPAAVGPQKPE